MLKHLSPFRLALISAAVGLLILVAVVLQASSDTSAKAAAQDSTAPVYISEASSIRATPTVTP
jgi:hypothetical protein